MPVYGYRGINSKGKAVEGVIDAASAESARLKLKGSGIFITDKLRPEKVKEPSEKWHFLDSIFREKVSVKVLSLLTYNLKTLLEAGLPLFEALDALARQESNRTLQSALTYIKEEVSQGSSLSDSLKKYPDIFPSLYINVVGVGEETGTLDDALTQLSEYLDMEDRIRSKVIQASAYPMLMAAIGFFIILYLMSSVVPKVISVFNDTQAALPLPTRILVTISGFMGKYWFFLVAAVFIAVVSLGRYLKTERGRLLKESVISKIPLVGRLSRLFVDYRISKTMETLLRSAVPLSKALEICSNSIHSARVKTLLKEANGEVIQGVSLSEAFNSRGLLHGFLQMITVGERSGRLDEAFLRVSRVYERSIETVTESLLSLLEPVLIVVMGLVVGFIVLSILLPIFEMSQLAG